MYENSNSSLPFYPCLSEEEQQKPSGKIYKIKQKGWSFGDKFKIKDQFDADVFFVEEKLFTWGKNLMLEDTAGQPLIHIKQELLHLHPTFNIMLGGTKEKIAQLKQESTWFKAKFNVNSVYGQYVIKGEIFKFDYTISKGNDLIVAIISKKGWAWADTYGVEIIDGEDHPFILALVIIIDQVLHDSQK